MASSDVDEKQIELQMQNTEQEAQAVPQHSEDYSSLASIDNKEIDKEALWTILQDTQCPLMPDRYEHSKHEQIAPYYFNGEFWIDDEDNPNVCRMVQFPDTPKTKEGESKPKRRAKDDTELMLAVDEYIKDVRINKSPEIYAKLKMALAEKTGAVDDGDDSNDAYQKLVPTPMGRVMFLTVFFTTALNGYFLTVGLFLAMNGRYNTALMNNLALVMSICELILYANILLGHVVTYFLQIFLFSCRGENTYIQTKVIAQELRNLSTLSILRFMPSIEIVSSWIVHWRESIARIWLDFYLIVQASIKGGGRRSNVCEIIFAVPVYLVELVAPILAVYAILVKIKQLDFVMTGEPFADWNLTQYIAFAAFLNQVAGLRVLRNVETASIQHFVFSGADASLDADELLLLDDWWNVTVLSAVSNLRLGWYDNMVFWYGLNPQKIQLLLKFHSSSDAADSDSLRQKIKDNDDILLDYDKKVVKMLTEYKK
eukprot:73923_1